MNANGTGVISLHTICIIVTMGAARRTRSSGALVSDAQRLSFPRRAKLNSRTKVLITSRRNWRPPYPGGVDGVTSAYPVGRRKRRRKHVAVRRDSREDYVAAIAEGPFHLRAPLAEGGLGDRRMAGVTKWRDQFVDRVGGGDQTEGPFLVEGHPGPFRRLGGRRTASRSHGLRTRRKPSARGAAEDGLHVDNDKGGVPGSGRHLAGSGLPGSRYQHGLPDAADGRGLDETVCSRMGQCRSM
jgi:hypothetical protein